MTEVIQLFCMLFNGFYMLFNCFTCYWTVFRKLFNSYGGYSTVLGGYSTVLGGYSTVLKVIQQFLGYFNSFIRRSANFDQQLMLSASHHSLESCLTLYGLLPRRIEYFLVFSNCHYKFNDYQLRVCRRDYNCKLNAT